MKFAVSIFKFFASLKLAIFLLLALAVFFAVGTFMESAYGTEAARLVIYRSPWMNVLLIFLALNVAAAALDRLPWQRKHVGFVVTHAGIILILAGSLVTRASSIEGQMAIREGKETGRIILGEPLLQIFSPDSGQMASFAVPMHAFPWQGRERVHSAGANGDAFPEITLLRYYPKASRREEITASSNGPAALRVVLQSSWMKSEHPLLLDDPERSRIPLGPAELRFTREPLGVEKEPETESFLEFRFPNSTVKIPLQENLPKEIPLKGTPYRVTVLRILKDAIVDSGKLVDRSSEWNNPACELLLEGEGLQERHTVFSKFPDFPTMHGREPSKTGVQIFYHRPESEGAGSKNELRFVWQENAPPLYQIRKGSEISEGPLEKGVEYETGWMDFRFKAEEYLPHARVRTVFSEEPVASQAETHLSAVEVEFEKDGGEKSLWLGQGDTETVSLGHQTFQIIYGLRMLPVGFRLRLRDFRVENYPGTNRPASFESDVTLLNDMSGTAREMTIRMNQPLQHSGFKVFQSGYQQVEGEPEVSIFTVARDPGIPIKYAGAVILISGILTMFYSRRFSSRPNQKEALLIQ